MSGRRVFVKDCVGNGGESFKIVLSKSDSEESMKEGELSDDKRDVDWNAPRTRVTVRLDQPDIEREVSVEGRKVLQTEETAEVGTGPVVRTVTVGHRIER